MEVSILDKEKILLKSRQSKQDEGLQFTNIQGSKIGFTFFTAVFAVLILFATFFAQTNQVGTIHALIALYLTFCTGEVYAKYKFFNKKSYLIVSFICSFAVIVNSIAYIVTALR